MVATYRSSDTYPKERFVHQQAGDGGYGGSSYIDLVAFREKDANTAWTTASDGTLEERLYYCQNQHADVVALITAAGTQREMDRYSAYGVPFGLPVGDVDSDGACLIADQNQVRDWALAPAYDVRGDLDLDGDVDLTDRNTLRDEFKGVTLGRGVLSAGAVGVRRGVAGYERAPNVIEGYNVRHRVYQSSHGQWVRRDPIGYVDGPSLYAYTQNDPQGRFDPSGQFDEEAAFRGGCALAGIPYSPQFPPGTPGGFNYPPTYGNWCGSGNNSGEPIDGTDTCCYRHDLCVGVSGFHFFCEDKSWLERDCDAGLCICLAKSRPTSPQEKAAQAVMKWLFCSCSEPGVGPSVEVGDPTAPPTATPRANHTPSLRRWSWIRRRWSDGALDGSRVTTKTLAVAFALLAWSCGDKRPATPIGDTINPSLTALLDASAAQGDLLRGLETDISQRGLLELELATYPSQSPDARGARKGLLILGDAASTAAIDELGQCHLSSWRGWSRGEYANRLLEEMVGGTFGWAYSTDRADVIHNQRIVASWRELRSLAENVDGAWQCQAAAQLQSMWRDVHGTTEGFFAAETVMKLGDRLTATSLAGRVSVTAGHGFERSYDIGGIANVVQLLPRREKWAGGVGIYHPDRIGWKSGNGIDRAVLQEGWRAFDTLDEALEWLGEQQRMMNLVYGSTGLALGWTETKERRQINVDVWQLTIGGAPPTDLPGGIDSAITLERK